MNWMKRRTELDAEWEKSNRRKEREIERGKSQKGGVKNER